MVGFGQFDRIPFTIFCFLFRICYILKIVWSDSDNLIGSESDLKGSDPTGSGSTTLVKKL